MNGSLERKAWGSNDRVEIYFKSPEQKRSADLLLCFPAEYTEYPFTVRMGEKRWSVRKRYREFHELDQQLHQIAEDAGDQLPELPSKVWVGSSSPILIEQRRVKLESYLRAVVAIPSLIQSGPVRSFLQFAADGLSPPDTERNGLLGILASCRMCKSPLSPGKETDAGLCGFCHKVEAIKASMPPRSARSDC